MKPKYQTTLLQNGGGTEANNESFLSIFKKAVLLSLLHQQLLTPHQYNECLEQLNLK